MSDDVDHPDDQLHVEHLENGFWDRASHKHIYNAALARMAAPWATLTYCAARALTLVPPHIKLPENLVGGPGSLNWFAAVVSKSGGGKGVAEAVSRELVPGVPAVRNLGSGEGIVKAYQVDADGRLEHSAILFNVAEIDTMTALRDRSASTTMGTLREVFSGGTLGFSYAGKGKDGHVEAHKYRMTLITAVQPRRAGGLLDDSAGGTPQRFMWFPADDPRISEDVAPIFSMRWTFLSRVSGSIGGP